MRSVFTLVAASLLTLGLGATGAFASTTFDLRGNGGLRSSYEFEVDGIKLTVTAGTFNGGSGAVTSSSNHRVGQYSPGLGATTRSGDQHYVDGHRNNDILIFQFDQKVIFESIQFSYVDSNDDFHFFVSPTTSTSGLDDKSPSSGWDVSSTYTFAPPLWMGELFGIGAKDGDDEFKVWAVTVGAAPPPNSSTQVPVPPALPFIAGGLLMLGAAGRWRRRERSES